MTAYQDDITGSTTETSPSGPSVAIIGAGMSGLSAANSLRAAGAHVRLFEKSRGPGGRMATRRTDGSTFDHGAQYFTARHPRFVSRVAGWIDDGIVSEWNGSIGVFESGSLRDSTGATKRFVGQPRMSALTRYLSDGLDISFNTRISSINRASSGTWRLHDDTGQKHGDFQFVLSSLPPDQASRLVGDNSDLAGRISNVRMKPCWALMVAFDKRVEVNYDGIFVGDDSSISWLARNSSKPGRGDVDSWVIHASAEWSDHHLEDEKSLIQDVLLTGFKKIVGQAALTPMYSAVHRWRYALAENPLNHGVLWDGTGTIGLIGDWTNGSRVEGAFLSGESAALQLIEGIPS
ncbi:MAG: NAD(P)-binding protein [Rhodothermales bacterium]|nr:NAD(P)-binding protein [Rhodothermales bacterium]